MVSYTIQLVIPEVCNKFQKPRYSGSREVFDKKVIGEKEKVDKQRKQ